MLLKPWLAMLLVVSAANVFAQEMRLRPGTRVRLTVQRTLSTHPHGGVLGLVGVKPITREDSLVVYEVAEDVYDEDGVLVIPAGSPATGTVIDSQVGGGFKPHAPRLAVTVERVLTLDGGFLPLRFPTHHEQKWAHVFGRDETGAYVDRIHSDATAAVFSRPENSDAVHELFELIVRGKVGSFMREPKKILSLKYLAQQSGLPTLTRFIQEGKILQVASIIADIQRGGFVLRSLTDAKRLLDAFKLMDETWKAGSELLGWVGGRIKAPQIMVPAGFPVEAVIAD